MTFTPSSRCDNGISVVFLLCGRPAGPDIVMDFTGSGGGLFPPPGETIELKKCGNCETNNIQYTNWLQIAIPGNKISSGKIVSLDLKDLRGTRACKE